MSDAKKEKIKKLELKNKQGKKLTQNEKKFLIKEYEAIKKLQTNFKNKQGKKILAKEYQTIKKIQTNFKKGSLDEYLSKYVNLFGKKKKSGKVQLEVSEVKGDNGNIYYKFKNKDGKDILLSKSYYYDLHRNKKAFFSLIKIIYEMKANKNPMIYEEQPIYEIMNPQLLINLGFNVHDLLDFGFERDYLEHEDIDVDELDDDEDDED
jgi:hypothetical protein